MVRGIAGAIVMPMLLAAGISASAQSFSVPPARSDRTGSLGVMRIQTQTHLSVREMAAVSLDEQRTIQEKLRRSIYEMATKECALISEVFQADCRMVSLNVNSNVQDRGNAMIGIMVSGSASFEVSPKGN